MKDKSEIIRLRNYEGLSEREISRRLGFSRITVHRILSEYTKALKEQEGDKSRMEAYILTPPIYKTENRPKRRLTEDIIRIIDHCLEENEIKKRSGRHKQRMFKQDIHELLVEQGYDISYSTVCGYISSTTRQREQESFIKQGYIPGEKAEFDWGEVKLCIAGRWQKLYMSAFALCSSNGRWGDLFHRQDTLAFMESHANYFEECKGVPHEVVYDNMRVAVASFAGNEKEPTQALLRMTAFYGFKYRFCNVRRGNEKGHVERTVEVLRRKAFCIKDTFDTIEQATEHLHQTCRKLNASEDIRPKLEEDLRSLLPYTTPMGCFERRELKVDKWSTFTLNTSHYSVPDTLVGRMVEVKIFSEKLLVYMNNAPVAEHERSYYSTWSLNLNHYLQTLKRKPGALSGSVALSQAPESIKELYYKYFTDNGKSFVDLLIFAKEHAISYDEIALAGKEAEQSGIKTVTAAHITTLLYNRLNQTPPLYKHEQKDEIEDFAIKQLSMWSMMMNNNSKIV